MQGMGKSLGYPCVKNYQHRTWFDRVIEKMKGVQVFCRAADCMRVLARHIIQLSKNSSKLVNNFLNFPADRQTNRQTAGKSYMAAVMRNAILYRTLVEKLSPERGRAFCGAVSSAYHDLVVAVVVNNEDTIQLAVSRHHEVAGVLHTFRQRLPRIFLHLDVEKLPAYTTQHTQVVYALKLPTIISAHV